MAHTPGPWRIRDTHMRYIEADGHLGPICDMRSRLDYPGMDPRVAETLEANARLIAAAPTLADALREIVAAWEIYNQKPSAIGYEVARDMAEHARAALKAAGVAE